MTNDLPFGLDIGVTTIKAVWMERRKTSYFLKSALSYPTPPKGMFSESPLDIEEMVQAIRRVVETAKIQTRFVNIAIAENLVYTKVVEMPLLSDKELASAIFWEAEQHIPVPLTDVVLDWKVLRKTEEKINRMQVLLVAAPNVLVEKYQKIISLSGLVINSIETELLAAARAILETEKSFPPSLIVQIGSINTSLIIVKDDTIVFSYSIPIGGTAINRAIAADFGLSLSEAEEYKKAYGLTEKILGGQVSKTTQNVLQSILDEVKKALVFYSEKYKIDNPIKQIILSGGTARLPGIDLFFVQNCGIETIIANPWKVLNGQQIPEEINRNGCSYTVAVGLSMRGYDE